MYIKILNEHEIRLIYVKINREDSVCVELLNSLFVNMDRRVYFMSDKQDVIDLLKKQTQEIGASLVVVTHDQRLKDVFASSIEL